jgi:hypothetical protein
MNTEMIGWRPLSPEVIADLPEEPAVFEVATLVRTVHYIGSADGNLRSRLAALIQDPAKLRPSSGGYYFRYERVAHEEEVLSRRLSSYSAGHRGRVPVGNCEGAPALRVASRRAA